MTRNKREGPYVGRFYGKHIRAGTNEKMLTNTGLKWRYNVLPRSWAARIVELNREPF
jgi:hypothetical protein